RRRRRDPEHERLSHPQRLRRRRTLRDLDRPLDGQPRLGGSLRHPGDLTVSRRRDDRREIGHHSQRQRDLGAPQPRTGDRGQEAGYFDRESTEIDGVIRDEGPRPGTTREKMAELPVLMEGGTLTAASASQISDGAAALLI